MRRPWDLILMTAVLMFNSNLDFGILADTRGELRRRRNEVIRLTARE